MHVSAADWTGRVGRILACASMALLPMVASAAVEEDPWEGVNRKVFRFNDTLDAYAIKPVAKGYQWIAPQFVEDGVHNFFRNVGELTNLANDLLQGKMKDAGVDTSRLLINTTAGVLGFVDVATKMGLERNDEDFGQTLGAWGVKSGPYMVLPFFGPSTIRDAGGMVGDMFTQPYFYINNSAVNYGFFVAQVIDTRASLLSAEKIITGDKYIFVRNAYLQNREFRVKDGEVVDDF